MNSSIDFDNGIINGKLKQIRQAEKCQESLPLLISVWVCTIRPDQTKQVLSCIKEVFNPIDPYTFLHCKRLRKISQVDNTLEVILCSRKLYNSKAEVLNVLEDNDLSNVALVSLDIPSNSPSTREIALQWSQKYWPLAWKGNPNLQFLKLVKFDMDHEAKVIHKLMGLWETNHKPVTIFKYKDTEIISIDSRDKHPLHHSVMEGIQLVADAEKQKRQAKQNNTNYLLNHFTVYTSHEPCVMCCMALVHSRIARLIYLQANKYGGLESNYQLGDRDGLNWKFEIWRWLDCDIDAVDYIV